MMTFFYTVLVSLCRLSENNSKGYTAIVTHPQLKSQTSWIMPRDMEIICSSHLRGMRAFVIIIRIIIVRAHTDVGYPGIWDRFFETDRPQNRAISTTQRSWASELTLRRRRPCRWGRGRLNSTSQNSKILIYRKILQSKIVIHNVKVSFPRNFVCYFHTRIIDQGVAVFNESDTRCFINATHPHHSLDFSPF